MINALDQTGLAYFWQKITGRLATKADLVNGKVPASQLPASGGGGFEPTVIPCTLNYGDATPDGDMMTWSVQLPTGSYTSAVSAAEAGTPAIVKLTMQDTETNETTGESTDVTVGVMDVLLQEFNTGDSVLSITWVDEQSYVVVELLSTDMLDIVFGTSQSSAPSDYEINISCTAQQLLGGSFTASLASGVYSDAMSAAQNGSGVTVVLSVDNGYLLGKVPMRLMQPPQDDGEGGYTTGYGYGSMTVRTAFTGSEAVWNVAVKIDSNDTATITTTNMSASGDGLPAVTTADAGKFLQVDSTGAWAAVAIPNASGVSF